MDQDVGINIYLKNSVDELINHLNTKHKTLKDKKDDIKILKTYVDKL